MWLSGLESWWKIRAALSMVLKVNINVFVLIYCSFVLFISDIKPLMGVFCPFFLLFILVISRDASSVVQVNIKHFTSPAFPSIFGSIHTVYAVYLNYIWEWPFFPCANDSSFWWALSLALWFSSEAPSSLKTFYASRLLKSLCRFGIWGWMCCFVESNGPTVGAVLVPYSM